MLELEKNVGSIRERKKKLMLYQQMLTDKKSFFE